MDKSELKTFQNRLLKKRARLLGDVDMVEEGLREDINKPGEDSSIATHPADKDVEGVDEQVILAQNEEHMLEDVEAALARIEAGTYGKCENCGHAIAKRRLNAIPQASLCIKCARQEAG